jgi:uncharacterized protein
MKILFNLFAAFIFVALWDNVKGQMLPDASPLRLMNSDELSQYRHSIWDSLPAAIGWVNDFGELFKNHEEDTLESLIAHFEKKTTIEIMIVTIDTNMVAKDSIKKFATRLLKLWGIGKIFQRNGIVICICSGYHDIRISTGAGIMMDERGKVALLKKYFIPYYKKDQYYEGTFNGLKALMARLSY